MCGGNANTEERSRSASAAAAAAGECSELNEAAGSHGTLPKRGATTPAPDTDHPCDKDASSSGPRGPSANGDSSEPCA